MTDNTIGKSRAGERPWRGLRRHAGFLVDLARNAPAMMWTFTATTFLSALLLFAIQPMFAKTVLPVLGGSPSVWSVSVFFFQAALLAGYLYAHLLINKAPPHLTGIIHLVVCVLAFVSLPIGMVTWLGEPPAGRALPVAARHVRGLDRAAVRGGIGQCAAAAGVVCQKRPSRCARPLLHVCGEQPGQPDRAARAIPFVLEPPVRTFPAQRICGPGPTGCWCWRSAPRSS